MKTKTQIVKQDLADAVKNLNTLLKRDFRCDYAFIIMGHGHYVARHNIQGVIEPVTEFDAAILGARDKARAERKAQIKAKQQQITCGHVEKVLIGWKCQECGYQNAFPGKVESHLKKVHNYGTEDATLACIPVYRNEIPV